MSHQRAYEIEIFFASGDQLRYRKIVDFQTEAGTATGIFVVKGNEPIFPAVRQRSCFLSDSVRIITKRAMKWRTFPILPSIKSASFGSRSEKRSASMETRSSGGGFENWPRIDWLPIMINCSAPVIPVAARMICSSCCRCMSAKLRFNFPNLFGGKDACKWGILPETPPFVRFGNQN